MKATPSEGIFITTEQAKAVNVLLAAANVAQKAGAFSLADGAAVFEAVKTFATKKETQDLEQLVKGSLGPSGESD